ncbi:MAG: PL29 family lyase N-terminal domain-containing protein [Paludibacteraceae bacterium]|nr:PL29 family lyase N-terminal domain-containing protein [Paludibacteraceae bacterium]
MKKLHLLLLSVTLCVFSACHNDIWDAIDGLDSRVTKLEELCKEMNTNITSLQTIVDVLQSNDFITGVVEIKKDGEVIGYTITFGKHDPITIYHGQDGQDGADGKDGQDGQNGSANAPVIGVAQDTDGVYYWTLNGEWLLDDNGNKLPVSGEDGKDGANGADGKDGQDGADGKDGISPLLKIENGYWYISYDNGATWTESGKATGDNGQNGQNGTDGKDGQDGANGQDGVTPLLKIENGYWYISYDNGATWAQLGKATGEDGKDGANGTNGADGKDGQDGADGSNGQDGITPQLKIENGYWYVSYDNGATWTQFGKATGADGQDGQNGTDGKDGQDGKDGVTPQLKIEEGYWFISYDNGATWTQLGKATGEDGKDGIDGENGKDGQNGADGKDGQDGDSMFQSVTQDENYVYFTLADGTVIKIAKASEEEQPNSEFMFIVTYDANGGVGTMKPDTFYYGVSKQLSKVKYTKSAHIFTYWNTKADGSGISYEDGQTLMISKNITLYAQWDINLAGIGIFSVGEGKRVTFSKGNLQYHPANDEWRFAENQTDYIGDANANISSTYNGWLDLFGWGTGDAPTKSSTSTNYNDYQTFVDWGTNQIGGDAPNTWRTLTYSEWEYLLNTRPNASSLKGVARVNGVNGLILLPDNWRCPAGVIFKSGFHSEWGVEYYAIYQTFTAAEWSKLESAGAVFLPAAGDYYGSYNVVYLQRDGYYWSATMRYRSDAYCLYFLSDEARMIGSNERFHGLSVRLVKDL